MNQLCGNKQSSHILLYYRVLDFFLLGKLRGILGKNNSAEMLMSLGQESVIVLENRSQTEYPDYNCVTAKFKPALNFGQLTNKFHSFVVWCLAVQSLNSRLNSRKSPVLKKSFALMRAWNHRLRFFGVCVCVFFYWYIL